MGPRIAVVELPLSAPELVVMTGLSETQVRAAMSRLANDCNAYNRAFEEMLAVLGEHGVRA